VSDVGRQLGPIPRRRYGQIVGRSRRHGVVVGRQDHQRQRGGRRLCRRFAGDYGRPRSRKTPAAGRGLVLQRRFGRRLTGGGGGGGGDGGGCSPLLGLARIAGGPLHRVVGGGGVDVLRLGRPADAAGSRSGSRRNVQLGGRSVDGRRGAVDVQRKVVVDRLVVQVEQLALRPAQVLVPFVAVLLLVTHAHHAYVRA